MKIISVDWFTEMGETRPIGIVVIENEMGERKAYIGKGAGYNEEIDKRHISKCGGKLMPRTLESILKHLQKD